MIKRDCDVNRMVVGSGICDSYEERGTITHELLAAADRHQPTLKLIVDHDYNLEPLLVVGGRGLARHIEELFKGFSGYLSPIVLPHASPCQNRSLDIHSFTYLTSSPMTRYSPQYSIISEVEYD